MGVKELAGEGEHLAPLLLVLMTGCPGEVKANKTFESCHFV